jgi:hypothetical protein
MGLADLDGRRTKCISSKHTSHRRPLGEGNDQHITSAAFTDSGTGHTQLHTSYRMEVCGIGKRKVDRHGD